MSFIPVNEPLLNGNEKKYLCECIDTGWISSEGPFVTEFENKMSQAVNREYGIAVSNGTAALEIAVRALGISEGDEVIMPTFTIMSCAMAVTKLGGVPVLVDSDLHNWNMLADQIEQKVTKKTKAIMMVHLYGLAAEVSTVLAVAKKYGLKVIEDAAEMHGQLYDGKPCGSFGDISIFSFYPNKHVTTGEGGMIVTNDETLAEKCRSYRNLCFKKEVRYVHDEISGNYRFTNLQAAVGLAQLERLDEFVRIKRKIGCYYNDRLKDIGGLLLPIERNEHCENIYWVYGLVLDESIEIDNQAMVKMLASKGIGARTFFWCMHEQPVYRELGMFKGEKYPQAEYLARKGFYIPSGLALKEEQQEQVVKTIRDVMRELIHK